MTADPPEPARGPVDSAKPVSPKDLLFPLAWRRAFGAARVLLALSGLSITVASRGWDAFAYTAPAWLYIGWTLAALTVRALQRPAFLLLHLLLDSVLLLLTVRASTGSILWLAALWFVYLMLCGMLKYGWRQAGIVAAGCIAYVTLSRPSQWESIAAAWTATALAALFALSLKQRLEERLYSVSRQAVLFRSEAARARTDERERIAADFHDGPLQIFMSLQMRLEVARRLFSKSPDAARKEIEEMAGLWKSQIVELRAFLHAMRASDVDASDLFATLSRTVEAFQKETGIETAFSASGTLELQQPALAVEIVQVVREALHNVRKHTQATHVSVKVAAAGGWLEIAVDDNGGGFPFSGAFSLDDLEVLRIGPGTIKRRVRAMGGDLTVESMLSRGATLRIRVPQ
jgi:signal transduction histidine kinase